MNSNIEATSDLVGAVGTAAHCRVIATLAERRNDVMSASGLTRAALERRVEGVDSDDLDGILSTLEGQFVVETDGGFRLLSAGKKLHETLLALEHGDTPSRMAADTDHECPLCERAMQAVYEDGDLRYDCPTHEDLVRIPVSPTTAAHGDIAKLVDVANLETRHRLELAQTGVCWNCRGRMTADLLVEPPARQEETTDDPPLARYRCELCETELGVLLSQCLATNGDVVSFYRARGCDLTERSFIDIESAIDIVATDRIEGDPPRVRVRAERDGDTLVATLDERGSVVDVDAPVDNA